MPHAVVLGAGMVGSVMAADLAADRDFTVTAVDSRRENLDRAAARAPGRVRVVQADLADPAHVKPLIADADIVLGALASRLGLATLRAVIDAGRNYCDISFMPEDALALDALARDRGVTAVVDCGVAPGMSNLLAGYAVSRLDAAHSIEIYVGGLPRERAWPFQYKAAFSPADVVEEYTRPARIVEHGQVVTRPALSEPELIDFPGLGTLEAFNTDGLRSLAFTLNVPHMKEKTLRYPGHIELMRVLRHLGLFGKDPIAVPAPDGKGTVSVRPLDLISTLMFPLWSYAPGEEDLTVMRVVVRGTRAGADSWAAWDLHDVFDRDSKATSMARTTAFPCTVVARMIADGRIRRPGVIPPETLGAIPGVADAALAELARRGIRYTRTGNLP